MGNCIEKIEFHPEESVPGQNTDSYLVFQKLLLSDKEINKLYAHFRRVLIGDHAFMIRYTDICVYFHMDGTGFNRKLFSPYESDRGKFTFLQFVCAVWFYLSFFVTIYIILVFYM